MPAFHMTEDKLASIYDHIAVTNDELGKVQKAVESIDTRLQSLERQTSVNAIEMAWQTKLMYGLFFSIIADLVLHLFNRWF